MTDSPAAELRRAASLLQERAGKATDGPWKHMCLGSEGCLVIRDHATIRERGHGRVARFGCKDWQADHADAEFVAMMSPPVALLLADLLEDEARLEFGAVPDTPLLLARAILNEAERLSALVSEEQGLPDLAAVIGTILDHVQQGIVRPGSWERGWLIQALGDYWLGRLEPDPDSPFFDMVRKTADG